MAGPDNTEFSRPVQAGRSRVLLSGSACLETPAQQALERAARSGQAMSVVRLYLSRLHPSGLRPHHRRIARCLFDDAVQQCGGQVFACANGDLSLLAGPDSAASLGSVLLRLFRAEAPCDRQLIGLWSLPEDEAALRAEFAAAPDEVGSAEESTAPLGVIAAIGALLASAPCGELMRRQTAVRIDDRRMRRLFHELSVSFPALEGRIGMRVPSGADPYLFRYIAGQLDGRMLASLARTDLSNVPALNINLPLACAALPAFGALRAAARQAGTSLGIEIPFVEAVADMRRFTSIRESLQADGCTIVLDGIDHQALLHCAPAALGPDLLKLEWSARIPAMPAREQRRLGRALQAADPDRVVLCRAETESALVWGRAQGISCFQGRHVDAMLAADRITLCPHSGGCTLGQCIGRAAATDDAGQSGCHDPSLLDGILHRGPGNALFPA